jgi:polysaccharide export outer membrane protein
MLDVKEKTLRTFVTLVAVLGLTTASTGGDFHWNGEELTLVVDLPAGEPFRVEQTVSTVRIVVPRGTAPADLGGKEDPRHLIDRAEWICEGENPAAVLRLGTGELAALERSETALVLAFRPSLASANAYVLGPGDKLSLDVYGEEDLSGELTVDPAGDLQVDLIGGVRAAGRTPEEVAEAIRVALGKDYLVNPRVSLDITEYREQYVTVSGPVASPGKVRVRGPIPLSRAISEAGGFADRAGFRITVSRLQPDGSTRTYRIARLDLQAGLEDPVVHPDDLVVVAAPEIVFIDGEVVQSGAVVLSPGLTLMRAVALARGTTPWADESDVQVHREVGGASVLETFNLKRIRAHKAPDPELRPGDLVVVPRRFL